MEEIQYRFYGFGNYYLSSLQQGLQAGHTVAQLFVEHTGEKLSQVHEWAKNHKTMVLLNGGNSLSLANLHEKFNMWSQEGMPFAFAKFNEDEQSLGGALTYVGIILPNDIYDAAAALRAGVVMESEIFGPSWLLPLLREMNCYGLAH